MGENLLLDILYMRFCHMTHSEKLNFWSWALVRFSYFSINNLTWSVLLPNGGHMRNYIGFIFLYSALYFNSFWNGNPRLPPNESNLIQNVCNGPWSASQKEEGVAPWILNTKCFDYIKKYDWKNIIFKLKHCFMRGHQ